MDYCIKCGKEIIQKSRGRKREYCDTACRVAYYRLEKRYTKVQKRVTNNTYHNPDKLHLKPITLREANAFVKEHHSHHGKVVGHKFSIGAVLNDHLVGVVIVGRPVSRMMDDGFTAEDRDWETGLPTITTPTK